jgi:putative heme iron utilization protein
MTVTSDTPAVPPPPPRDPRSPADFDPVAEAKRLLRGARSGSLAAIEADGAPFVSLVNVATDIDGAPLLLVSGLSRHTRLMAADPRVALMLAQTGKGDPLAHPRLSVMGRIAPTKDERARRRFLARHPKSAMYADFGDFSFMRMEIGSAHLNGGFARAAELEPGHVLTTLAGAEALVAIEAEAVAHMNEDHGGAVAAYAALVGAGEGRWRVSGLDPEGIDLASGDKTARLAFPARVADGGALRRTLAALAEEARRKS